MIDKNGKLFGKINLIDLLIILIIVAALVFFGVKTFGAPADDGEGELDENGEDIEDIGTTEKAPSAAPNQSTKPTQSAAPTQSTTGTQNTQTSTKKSRPVLVTFYAGDAPIVLKDQMEEQLGRDARDWENKKSSLGTFVSYEAEDGISYTWDSASGELVELPDLSTFRLTFNTEVDGIISTKCLNIGTLQYYIGGSYVVCVGQTRISCRLADFEYVDD